MPRDGRRQRSLQLLQPALRLLGLARRLLPLGLKPIAVGAESFQLPGQAPQPCRLGRPGLEFGTKRSNFSLEPITIDLEPYCLIREPLLLAASRFAFRFELCEPRGGIGDMGFVLGSHGRNLVPQPVALCGDQITLAVEFLVGLQGFRVRRFALAVALQFGPKRSISAWASRTASCRLRICSVRASSPWRRAASSSRALDTASSICS